jgi:hypothetical protein
MRTQCYNLAVLYFRQKRQPEDALRLSEHAVSLEKTSLHCLFLGQVYVWQNRFAEAVMTFKELLDDPAFLEEYAWHFSEYLILLLAKEQYSQVNAYFNDPALNLQERFKPLYYALLRLMDDPDSRKMPPELAEPVEDILKQVKQMAEEYQ